MTKLLSEFTVGERGVIRLVTGEGAIRRRLFDMGLTPGAEVFLRKTAGCTPNVPVHRMLPAQ